jgi:hypothetical protein
MSEENKQQEINEPPRKLCSNCAYREHCKKRFSANVVNGQVICNEHAFDVSVIRKAED